MSQMEVMQRTKLVFVSKNVQICHMVTSPPDIVSHIALKDGMHIQLLICVFRHALNLSLPTLQPKDV
jgi:hypothetical protein